MKNNTQAHGNTTPGAVMVFVSVCNSLGTNAGYVASRPAQEVAR